MAGEEVVGGIVGFLRMDADQFHREIKQAIAEILALKGMDAKVEVKTDVDKVRRDLDGVRRSAQGVTREVGGMSRSFRGLQGPGVIVGAIGAGMALIGPLTGAATAAMGGFVGVVGTGVLAFQGFKKEIEEGTALGKYLQGQLDGIKGEFGALGATAASAMQGDVLSGLSEIRRFLPTLNDDVEGLAGHLGRAFNTSAKGLVTGLQNAMPLLQDGGRYAEVLANKFAEFTASQDFRDFIDYARRELPNVGAAMFDLAGGIKDLGVALAPIGDDLVTLISLLGKGASVASHFVEAADKMPTAGLFWIDKFGDLLGKLRGDTEGATDAVDEHTSHLLTLTAAVDPLAAGLGVTNQALQDAKEKHRKTADAASEATLQMQLEGDAAGLLKQALDQLNGKTLDLASAQTNSAAATLRVTDSLKENGKTLSLNTSEGVKNRQAIEAKVRADQAAAEAAATASGGTIKATDALKGSKKALEDNLRAQGLLTPAIQRYIDKIYVIPKVAPTKAEFESKQALTSIQAFQTAIDKLHGKTVGVHTRYTYEGRLPNGGRSTQGGSTFAAGGVIGYAKGGIPGYAGGTIVGPGTGVSDSILAMVAQTKEMIRVSNGEFISTAASQRRNRAALEAGNKGATLAVAGSGGGMVALDAATIAAIAAAVSRVQVRSVVTAGQFDRAMGGALR